MIATCLCGAVMTSAAAARAHWRACPEAREPSAGPDSPPSTPSISHVVASGAGSPAIDAAIAELEAARDAAIDVDRSGLMGRGRWVAALSLAIVALQERKAGPGYVMSYSSGTWCDKCAAATGHDHAGYCVKCGAPGPTIGVRYPHAPGDCVRCDVARMEERTPPLGHEPDRRHPAVCQCGHPREQHGDDDHGGACLGGVPGLGRCACRGFNPEPARVAR